MNQRLIPLCSLLFVFCILSCEEVDTTTDPDIDSCAISIEGEAYYKNTAQWLSLNYLYSDNSMYATYRDSLEIPTDLLSNVTSRLGKIYDLTNVPERDSIIDVLDITENTALQTSKLFMLTGNFDEPWLKNLFENNSPTGNITFDNLMNRYGYTVDRILQNTQTVIMDTANTEPFNIYELIRRIKEAPESTGLEYIEANSYSHRARGVTFDINMDEKYIFSFNYGWGDCPSGCYNNRFWEFAVDKDCAIEVSEGTGDIVTSDDL